MLTDGTEQVDLASVTLVHDLQLTGLPKTGSDHLGLFDQEFSPIATGTLLGLGTLFWGGEDGCFYLPKSEKGLARTNSRIIRNSKVLNQKVEDQSSLTFLY